VHELDLKRFTYYRYVPIQKKLTHEEAEQIGRANCDWFDNYPTKAGAS